MSGTPKKPHEEAGHSSSSSKYLQEETGTAFPNLGGKLTPPVVAADQYHAPIEMGPDAWMSKISRTDSRDTGKKSPLHSIYRIPFPSSNDPHLDNTMTINSATESSLELRDPKDNKESKGVENRESKVEARERDSLNSKGEKDERFENRGVDGKEIKHTWDSKGEIKYDWPHQSYWKEAREHNKGYTDKSYTPFSSMAGPVTPVEGVKDSLPTDEKDYTEAREAVGENKIDDKFKEKDRKRKDGKHRDRVEKGDRRSLPPGNNYNEGKDLMREDREPDRWASERKDFPKENERIKEREIEHNKTEKEAAHSEKDLGDGSFRMLERENLASEQKRRKDLDGWKNLDKDGGEVKKERDVDLDGERPEKRIRYSDKDSDEGCAEAEGCTEKEKEAFNYGVQQRKRMLRPRGSPLSNRESRYKSEGSQGKPDVSTVVYKVGECMQELIKLWKEYEADKKSESSQSGPTLEIRIPAEYVTATNRQVRGGQLWGTDIYTDDSDLVAVLMHTGYCRPTASPPPPSIQELGATIRVLPPQDCYVSTLRNNVRSRAWGAAIGCSYRVERCCIVKKGGGTIDLEPCLTHTSTVEPTLAPVAVERTMTTRAAASNALRQQRFVREVTIQYNLCNEPWIKYSISIVADKGLKKPMYTSARLKKGEVLYLETHSQRYELCFSGEKVIKPSVSSQVHETEADKAQNNHLQTPNGERSSAESENVIFDAFRWCRCKKALPQRVMRSVGIPLPLDYVEVLEENIDWEDIEWSQTGVYIAKKEYALARVHFLSPN